MPHDLCRPTGKCQAQPMPLFDEAVDHRLLWPLDAVWPRRRARHVLAQYQARWPELAYDMDLAVDLANAQAFLEAGRRRVRLYGGLARHRRIGSAGLSVALAHETGHHLGGPPFHAAYRWLSSEDQADHWAKTIGLPVLFGAPAAAKIWARGRGQLVAICGC